MLVGHHEHHLLVVERLELQRPRNTGPVGNAQVERALLQPLGDQVGREFVDPHAHARIALLEARDAVGNEAEVESVGGADA
ncbi:hypothetical protein FQZ97_1122610 [compost metagenome]